MRNLGVVFEGGDGRKQGLGFRVSSPILTLNSPIPTGTKNSPLWNIIVYGSI